MFTNLNILVTGGTGSIGTALVRRLLSGSDGVPKQIRVFSRGAGTHQRFEQALLQEWSTTPDTIDPRPILRFVAGDIAEYGDVVSALHDVDVVFHTAAMKLVTNAEYDPDQAIRVNVQGAQNLVHAIRDYQFPVKAVIGVSSDKACQPENVMGMTKALQERIFTHAGLDITGTRFASIRFGNVLASDGSAVSLFLDQAKQGGPMTITSPDMTRFLISIDDAVSALIDTYRLAGRGEVVAPRMPAARMVDLARAVMWPAEIPITYTGIRPGEKVHETLVSADEAIRTVCRKNLFAIRPALPELVEQDTSERTGWTCRSDQHVLSVPELREMLMGIGLLHAEQDVLQAGS